MKKFVERFNNRVKSVGFYRGRDGSKELGTAMSITKRLTSRKGTSYIEYFIAGAAMSVATAAILAAMSGNVTGSMFGGWFNSFF